MNEKDSDSPACAGNALCVISYLKEQIPDLRFKNGIRQKISSYLFWTTPNLYLNLNYAIRRFIRMVYR